MSRKEDCKNCHCSILISNDTDQCAKCHLYMCSTCYKIVRLTQIEKHIEKTNCEHECYPDAVDDRNKCNHMCCVKNKYVYCDKCLYDIKYKYMWIEFKKYYNKYKLNEFYKLFRYIDRSFI